MNPSFLLVNHDSRHLQHHLLSICAYIINQLGGVHANANEPNTFRALYDLTIFEGMSLVHLLADFGYTSGRPLFTSDRSETMI